MPSAYPNWRRWPGLHDCSANVVHHALEGFRKSQKVRSHTLGSEWIWEERVSGSGVGEQPASPVFELSAQLLDGSVSIEDTYAEADDPKEVPAGRRRIPSGWIEALRALTIIAHWPISRGIVRVGLSTSATNSCSRPKASARLVTLGCCGLTRLSPDRPLMCSGRAASSGPSMAATRRAPSGLGGSRARGERIAARL